MYHLMCNIFKLTLLVANQAPQIDFQQKKSNKAAIFRSPIVGLLCTLYYIKKERSFSFDLSNFYKNIYIQIKSDVQNLNVQKNLQFIYNSFTSHDSTTFMCATKGLQQKRMWEKLRNFNRTFQINFVFQSSKSKTKKPTKKFKKRKAKNTQKI